MTPHPYAEILRAIADGKQIQMQARTGEWLDVQDFQVLDNAANGPYAADSFRIKHEPKKARYRVAEMREASPARDTCTQVADTAGQALCLENSPNFIRWLTDWVEYEVSE